MVIAQQRGENTQSGPREIFVQQKNSKNFQSPEKDECVPAYKICCDSDPKEQLKLVSGSMTNPLIPNAVDTSAYSIKPFNQVN